MPIRTPDIGEEVCIWKGDEFEKRARVSSLSPDGSISVQFEVDRGTFKQHDSHGSLLHISGKQNADGRRWSFTEMFSEEVAEALEPAVPVDIAHDPTPAEPAAVGARTFAEAKMDRRKK